MTKFSKITGSRLWSLHCDTVFLLRQKTDFPSGVAILFSIEKLGSGETYKNGSRAKLQVIKGRITSKSPLRFLGNVPIGIWLARDHFISLTMRLVRWSNCLLIGLPSRLVRGIGEQRIGRALFLGILLLEPISSLSLPVSPLPYVCLW